MKGRPAGPRNPPEGRLRIGFVFDDSLDVNDGVQQYIVTLGRELARRGHEVHYLVGETSRHPVPGIHPLAHNVMVAFNGNRMRIPLPAGRGKIRRVLSETPFDVLHVQAPYSPFLAGRVLESADPRTGVVATYHIASTGRLQYEAGRLLGVVNRHSHSRVDRVIAVSPAAAAYARGTAGADALVIPNPVDTARFRRALAYYGPEPVARLRSGGPHVVFLGRFVERKGPQALLRALAWGRREGVFPPGMHVTMGGRGPLLDECRRMAEGIDMRVDFPGFISEADKPELLASADVAVFPSTVGETFGIVLLEAMACGALILAGDNPGYRYTLEGDDDSLFPISGPDATADLAKKIARALDDPAWAGRVRARQAGLLSHYEVASVADRTESVYRKAIQDRATM